jgi:plasmid stabilization system protein ParE
VTLAVAFRSAARSEFDEAALRYESNRAGLGAGFIAAIGQAVSLAAEQPLRYPVIHRSIRRVRAKRFPYSVYYVVEAERIVILSVFHSSRSPLVWQQRG